MLRFCCACLALFALLPAPPAHAWGDEGHEVVALIADHYLTGSVRARVQALLASDPSGLTTGTSMPTEATWADRYRDSDRDGARVRYERTRRWHYVNLEIGQPDLVRACAGRAALSPGTPASEGPADDCVVDKIDQFAAELGNARTTPAERRLALQFLLHLVGDLHQPLHAADEHDEGGNRERVLWRAHRPGSLHQYWDTAFVEALGREPAQVASQLIGRIRSEDLRAWQRGGTADWARQSYELAARVAYGALPASGRDGRYRLSAAYINRARQAVGVQLSRAGVRLALLLNRTLGAAAD